MALSKIILITVVLLAVMLLQTAISTAAIMVKLQDLKDKEKTIQVTGTGLYPDNPDFSIVEKRKMAERAATIDGYRKLLEQVNEIQINSESKMKDLSIQHDEVSAKVSGFIKGAKIVEVRDNQDGIVEVDVMIELGKDFHDTFKAYIR